MSRAIKQFAATVLESVGREMYGVDEIVRMSLVALYTGGHILLEGNPGLGKTELVKTLGKVLRLPFGRIQFTPDLMPSDITGTLMPDPNDRQRLAFKPGPLFTSLLLADEINRATPKTQSAMLEAMAERQVTVVGEKKQLPAPFTVLATQNPIDHEGTYRLPEAQSDRFMFKALMPIPERGTLRKILKKQTGASSEGTPGNPTPEDPPERSLLPKNHEDSRAKYEALRAGIERVEPLPSLEIHVLNMFLASNGRFGELEGLDGKQVETLKILTGELITYGLGPRAPIAMMLGAKAWSLLFLQDAEYAEGAGLARVVLPILRHRLMLEFDWRDRFRARFDAPDAMAGSRERLMEQFCLAAAPKQHEYYRTFQVPLQEAVHRDLSARGHS